MSSSEKTPVLRLTFFAVLLLGMLLALFARLWFVQVLAGERYAVLADSNRTQAVYIEAPRGRILDRAGEPIVTNVGARVIAANRRDLLNAAGDPRDEEAAAVLARLSDLLGIEPEEIVDRLVDVRTSPFASSPIAVGVTPEVVAAVNENQELFPGVVAEVRPVRDYPHDGYASHVLGYVGQINEDELDAERFAGYSPGDIVGKTGLELSYEEILQGRKGMRQVEVNASGTVVDVLSTRDPVPGNDLVTSLDLDLQMAAERLLEEGMRNARDDGFTRRNGDGRPIEADAGAVIAMDPRTGEILAMASNPTYRLSEFVGGLRQEYADYVNNPPDEDGESEDRPTPAINRAIQAAFAPGSVFKIATGAAFVDAGLVTPTQQIGCPSSWDLGTGTFRNWNRSSEPAMGLARSLTRSCDTYYYELAHRQWQREERAIAAGDEPEETMAAVARRFGYGQRLGIDLPSEAAGNVPDRAWRQELWEANQEWWCAQAETETRPFQRQLLEENCTDGMRWRGGDPVNMSIGQGYVTSTLLQVATSYAAVANGGELLWPHLGVEERTPDGETVQRIEPEVLGELGVDDATLSALQQGLRDVVMASDGTASGAFENFPLDQVPVAGKTGSAEMPGEIPNAWFAAYAPADDPEIVVAVLVEKGHGGGYSAAPIVAAVLQHYFDFEVEEVDSGTVASD
ncbi:penicillin-binding protein 2 [Nitriliruptoraceae bacterium ZYF776]|nr:penicillin-binding protein 2 [Profundirhabdus halotolerans]